MPEGTQNRHSERYDDHRPAATVGDRDIERLHAENAPVYVPIRSGCHTQHVRLLSMTTEHIAAIERSAVIDAIRSSWCADTIAEGDWDADNPAKGQCEPSSFAAWRYLGGDLVLGRVLVGGEQVEHHYWNRIDGEDLDLTREQFGPEHVVEELRVVPNDFLVENMASMKPQMLNRIGLMSAEVAALLGHPPTRP